MMILGASDFWSNLGDIIKRISFFDVLDIIVVAVMLYFLFKFIRDRRAGKLAIGVVILLILRILSELLNMYLLQYIMRNIFQVGLITLVILFQPELRSALEKMGATPLRGIRSIGDEKLTKNEAVIREVVSAAVDLSATKTGALIVFERETKLGDLILTGTVIDSNAVAPMIKNIFFNKAPMHDGAVIIRDGRLYAAGCFLPLSDNHDIIKDLGTRHRAGIGMSENSDAVVVIVSEETGTISTAVEGKLIRGYRKETLESFLRSRIISRDREDGDGGSLFGKIRNFFRKLFRKKEKKTEENK